MKLIQYLRLWLACARYSVIRSMMFRMDFIMWSLVELFWMGVNVSLVAVVYEHTETIAGWGKYEMLLLVGSSMIVQRMLMGFFWSNLFELGQNVRNGNFDFFLAQPGNILFMVSTRKVDLEGIVNVFVASSVVVYAATKLGLHPTALDPALYVAMMLCGLMIHYSIILLCVSLTFWITKAEGVEHSYFSLTEFSRLPRAAFKDVARGIPEVLFVYILPVVVVSNVPARLLMHGFEAKNVLWLGAAALGWLSFAVWIFHRGLRRYSSASS